MRSYRISKLFIGTGTLMAAWLMFGAACSTTGKDPLEGPSGGEEEPRLAEAAQPISISVDEDVSAGVQHTLFLRHDGTVHAWGRNTEGQIGKGVTSTREVSPIAISGLAAIKAVAAGGFHSLALDTSGAVWGWGQNTQGQIGQGGVASSSTPPVLTPTKISGLPTIKAIAAGYQYSLALDTERDVRREGQRLRRRDG